MMLDTLPVIVVIVGLMAVILLMGKDDNDGDGA